MMKYEEIEKLVTERNELEIKLREQLNEKLKMLMDANYSENESYRLLANKLLDYRTLKDWHTGKIMKASSYEKLMKLLEDGQD